ncbi:NADH dehydrogenase [ubiquinone] 1 beta subcomplex subunit 1-like [Zalophus californianus]|uniref:NADH dehydrogenase [ubiquinone] 1 beta subcomplex subunit 1 n=1 Tax=Zalophus californianus TaxID=9704 RepID=A0A6P9FF53_ZALCA|nr:NADH dehydrogenase [ubiquinone] 1 beta subcomplex subunit 1-like [Zalophus californianus]
MCAAEAKHPLSPIPNPIHSPEVGSKSDSWVVAALGRGVVFGVKAAALRMNIIQIVRDHWVHILVPAHGVCPWMLSRQNDEKLTAFRNKSLLFKRELRPSEEVTWK